MKAKNLDKLISGDVLIVTSLTGIGRLRYELGERFVFDKLNILSPMSASTIYLTREKTNDRVSATLSLARNFSPLMEVRNSTIDKLLKE